MFFLDELLYSFYFGCRDRKSKQNKLNISKTNSVKMNDGMHAPVFGKIIAFCTRITG